MRAGFLSPLLLCAVRCVESRCPEQLPLSNRKQCIENRYRPTKPPSPVSAHTTPSPDDRLICLMKIQWPWRTSLPLRSIAFTEPSPPFISLIRWSSLSCSSNYPPTHAPYVLHPFYCPRKERTSSTWLIIVGSPTTALNRKHGQREKRTWHGSVIELHCCEHSDHLKENIAVVQIRFT